MAHFSKLGQGNIVVKVAVIENSVITDSNGVQQEQLGIDFLRNLYNEPNAVWKQTSYNTRGGKYYNSDNILATDQSKSFRKNYGTEGFRYDDNLDAFIPPKIFNSWIFNEVTCVYDPPVPCPDDGNFYLWDELRREWVLQPSITK